TLERAGLILLFGVALGVRLLYLALSPQTPVVWDAAGYYQAGVSLFAGQSPPEVQATLGRQGSGYPLFLAAVFTIFPKDPWSVRPVQAVLGALTCVLVYFVGRQLAGRRVGVVAGLLTALYPPLILFTGRLLTETLALFLFWLALAFLAWV